MTLKQSLKKYCLESKDGLSDLVEKMNEFMSKHEVGEIVDINYFQEQYNESIESKESFRSGLRERNVDKITVAKYGWKYMVIITILKEEDVERRLS